MAKLEDVTSANFEDEVLKSEAPVLVDFWAPWCGPCRALLPLLEKLADDLELRIVKVNVEEEVELAQRFRAMSIPMLVLFKRGSQAKKIVGAQPRSVIEERIRSVL